MNRSGGKKHGGTNGRKQKHGDVTNDEGQHNKTPAQQISSAQKHRQRNESTNTRKTVAKRIHQTKTPAQQITSGTKNTSSAQRKHQPKNTQNTCATKGHTKPWAQQQRQTKTHHLCGKFTSATKTKSPAQRYHKPAAPKHQAKTGHNTGTKSTAQQKQMQSKSPPGTNTSTSNCQPAKTPAQITRATRIEAAQSPPQNRSNYHRNKNYQHNSRNTSATTIGWKH